MNATVPRVAANASDCLALLFRHGAVVVEQAASDATMTKIDCELSAWREGALLGEGAFFGRATRRFSGLLAKAPSTAALVAAPPILPLVEAVLRGDGEARCDTIQLNLTQAIGIEPGERGQILHRDDVLFPFTHDFELMINAMWPLTPFSAVTGGTAIIPGSHLWARERAASANELVHVEAQPGDAVLYLGSTLHGGGANRSNRTRWGVVFSYSLGWLAQAERLLLTTPPHVARRLPERVQRLIGYQVHRPNLGWIEGRDPIEWLHGCTGELAAARDNFSPEQDDRVAARLASEHS